MPGTPPVSNGIPNALNQGKSLTERTISGMLWNMSGAGVQAVLQVAVVSVLARLLMPEDFGLVGAASIVIGFSQIFTQLGVGPAIVQRRDLRDEHVRAGFTFSLLLGLVFGTALFLSASLIAGFFRMEGLSRVVRVLALSYPLGGPTVVAEALLLRSMQFKKIVSIEVLSYALGYGIVGITLAMLGLGVWALVVASLCQAATKAVGFSLAGSLHVGFSLDTKPLCHLLNFGVGFSLARIANHMAGQGDSVIVGRWLGAEALGVYGRAYQFVLMPANLFGTVVDRVLFPAMAVVQNDRQRLAEAYLRAVSLVAMTTLPISAMLFALAPEIVHIVLGPHWDAVVSPFRILTVILVFRTSYKMSDSLARATGAVYRRAWRQWVYAGAVFVGAWLGHFAGTNGVAIGVAGAVILNFILMFELSIRLTPVPLAAVAYAHLRHLLIAVLLGAIAWGVASTLRLLHFPESILLVGACSAATGVLLILARFSRKAFGPEGGWISSLLRSRLRGTPVVLTFPQREAASGHADEGSIARVQR
jgi:PST family polysaccharide transporter